MGMEDGRRGGSRRGSVAGRGESGRGTTVVDMMMVRGDYIGHGRRRNARPVHVRVGDGGRLSWGSCAGRRWEGDESGSGKAEEEDKGRAPNLDTSTRICTTTHQSHNNSTAVKCAPPPNGSPITPIISSIFKAPPQYPSLRAFCRSFQAPPPALCVALAPADAYSDHPPLPIPPSLISVPPLPFHRGPGARGERLMERSAQYASGASSAEPHQRSAHHFPRCARSTTPTLCSGSH